MDDFLINLSYYILIFFKDLFLINFLLNLLLMEMLQPLNYQRIINGLRYRETFFHGLYYKREEIHKSFNILRCQKPTNL